MASSSQPVVPKKKKECKHQVETTKYTPDGSGEDKKRLVIRGQSKCDTDKD